MELLSVFAVSLLLQATPPPPRATVADAPFVCDNCEEWNRPQAPFKLHGRSYYVGTQGLAAILIDTGAGLILIDGGLPQSAAPIAASIRSLGLKVENIKVILNSHAHYDHAGGIARLQRASGASVMASFSSAVALSTGRPTADDPQYGRDGSEGAFPKIRRVSILKDRENVILGDANLIPRLTPGHTPGSTTWTWRSCDGPSCINIVYADSLNAVSSDGFRFLGTPWARDGSGPFKTLFLGKVPQTDISGLFKRSIATIASLPCDLLVSVHPGFSGLFDKLKLRGTKAMPDPMIDSQSCKVYAADAEKRLDARIKGEREGTVK